MKRFSILTIAFAMILALAGSASADPHPHGSSDSADIDISTTVGGDSFNYDFPVNTAAPVFAGNCAQGVSAQTMGFGGSIASGNSVCDFIAVAGAFIAGGERAEAFRVLGKAEKAADWRFLFSRIRMVITLGIL